MLVMPLRGYCAFLAFSVTSILLATASSHAQEIRCVQGCTLLEEETALRDAGLDPRDCDVALRLEIASDGSVEDVIFLRQDENRTCNETLVAFARKTHWSPAPDVARRTMSMSWSNDPKPRGAEGSGEAEFLTYPGGMGLDSDRYFLLAHPDAQVDLAKLRERFSRLGAFERIEEARSDSPFLCAIGRDSDDAVVFRSTTLDTAEYLVQENVFEHAAAAWPDLELLGAHAHTAGGSCFLLRAPAPSEPDHGVDDPSSSAL
jgi:hypothetical protein